MAVNMDRRPLGLTPQGLLLWNFEGLLRTSFPGSSEVSAKVDPTSSYNFVCRGDCSPHAVYSRYRYVFAALGGSAFHLSPRKFPPGYFGNYPLQILIRGRSVACNRKETRFLIEYSNSAAFELACL